MVDLVKDKKNGDIAETTPLDLIHQMFFFTFPKNKTKTNLNGNRNIAHIV